MSSSPILEDDGVIQLFLLFCFLILGPSVGSLCHYVGASHDWQETFCAVLFSLRTKLDGTQQEWDVPFAWRL